MGSEMCIRDRPRLDIEKIEHKCDICLDFIIHGKLLPIMKYITAKYCGFPVARTVVLGLIPDKFHKFV